MIFFNTGFWNFPEKIKAWEAAKHGLGKKPLIIALTHIISEAVRPYKNNKELLFFEVPVFWS